MSSQIQTYYPRSTSGDVLSLVMIAAMIALMVWGVTTFFKE